MAQVVKLFYHLCHTTAFISVSYTSPAIPHTADAGIAQKNMNSHHMLIKID